MKIFQRISSVQVGISANQSFRVLAFPGFQVDDRWLITGMLLSPASSCRMNSFKQFYGAKKPDLSILSAWATHTGGTLPIAMQPAVSIPSMFPPEGSLRDWQISQGGGVHEIKDISRYTVVPKDATVFAEIRWPSAQVFQESFEVYLVYLGGHILED